MNLPFLKKLAKKNPALARLIELSIYSIFVYILSAVTAGEVINQQAIVQAGCVPLIAYISKFKRDLEKE